MGKNGRFGKDYGKVVGGGDSKSRPGWKGPGFVKKPEPHAKPKAPAEKTDPTPAMPVELQQLLLDVFRNAYPGLLAADTLQPLLQDVKTALYERDFARAFGNREYLEAYSVRWSPSRALCYLSILAGLQADPAVLLPYRHVAQPPNPDDSPPHTHQSTLNVVGFGGGAAEVVAFGGFLRFFQNVKSTDGIEGALGNLSMVDKRPGIDLLLVDSAGWGDVVQTLNDGLTTPPPLSKYASAAVREANSSLIPAESINTNFRTDDILSLSQSQLRDIVGSGPSLLTLFFTLNELFTASIGSTTAFLLNLTTVAQPGTLLLVVDSPGSYSETAVGKEAKRYPMHWLLDHAMLENGRIGGRETPAAWAKVFSDDSRWFRLPEGLHYPIPLENMRYQISLYRRL